MSKFEVKKDLGQALKRISLQFQILWIATSQLEFLM